MPNLDRLNKKAIMNEKVNSKSVQFCRVKQNIYFIYDVFRLDKWANSKGEKITQTNQLLHVFEPVTIYDNLKINIQHNRAYFKH